MSEIPTANKLLYLPPANILASCERILFLNGVWFFFSFFAVSYLQANFICDDGIGFFGVVAGAFVVLGLMLARLLFVGSLLGIIGSLCFSLLFILLGFIDCLIHPQNPSGHLLIFLGSSGFFLNIYVLFLLFTVSDVIRFISSYQIKRKMNSVEKSHLTSTDPF